MFVRDRQGSQPIFRHQTLLIHHNLQTTAQTPQPFLLADLRTLPEHAGHEGEKVDVADNIDKLLNEQIRLMHGNILEKSIRLVVHVLIDLFEVYF